MSFYNIITGGPSSTSKLVLAILKEYGVPEIPRYRDVWIGDDEMVVMTRTGGNNRECYCWDCNTEEEEEEMEKKREEAEKQGIFHDDAGCYNLMNENLTKHPLYISDEDDDYDYTYAKFHFRIPEKLKNQLKEIYSQDQKSLGESTQNLIDSIKKMKPEEIREKFPQIFDVLDKVKKC